MKHKTMNNFALTIAGLLLSVGIFAHNGMEHVMGVVMAVSAKSMTVDTVQHKSVTVLLDSSTTFSHDNAQASASDLKVGDRVVIHAKTNASKQLVGSTVKWGAAKSIQSSKLNK